MAKQVGPYCITGSWEDVCFYQMKGAFYMRRHKPVKSRQFWKNKAFEGSRQSCRRLGEGSRIASFVYRSLPKEEQRYQLFCLLKREAIIRLKVGIDVETVTKQLMDMIAPPKVEKKEKSRRRNKKVAVVIPGKPLRSPIRKGLFKVLPLKRKVPAKRVLEPG